MTNPQTTALAAGLAAARTVAGVSVTYARGGISLTIQAIPADVEYRTLPESGSEIVVKVVPWLIAASDISTLSPPQVGDLITRGTTVYTVEHLGQGDAHWDWLDTQETYYRIRTREDGATAYTVTKPNGFDLQGSEVRY